VVRGVQVSPPSGSAYQSRPAPGALLAVPGVTSSLAWQREVELREGHGAASLDRSDGVARSVRRAGASVRLVREKRVPFLP
jgi:hypothetical protein